MVDKLADDRVIKALTHAFNNALAGQDWATAQLSARQHPGEAFTWLQQQGIFDINSPWHQREPLLIHAEIALHFGRRIEAGWALYFARRLGKGQLNAPAPLLHAAALTHPVWHQPLCGRRVRLLRPQERHRGFLLATLADSGFTAQYNTFLGDAEEATNAYLVRAHHSPEKLRQLDWVIESAAGEAIGLASIADLVWQHRRGELLIGFPGTPRPLMSAEATLLALATAFDCLGLKRLVSY